MEHALTSCSPCCVYRFITDQSVRVRFVFIPTKNKYSAQTELKQEEEEEEEEGSVRSLAR